MVFCDTHSLFSVMGAYNNGSLPGVRYSIYCLCTRHLPASLTEPSAAGASAGVPGRTGIAAGGSFFDMHTSLDQTISG